MYVMIHRQFERLMDTVINGIVAFSDYFVLQKKVTLSETTMFMFSFSWLVWFIFSAHVSEQALAQSVWITLFTMTTLAHLISFFCGSIIARAYVACAYAVVWCFLTLLSAYTSSVAPAVPTLAVFTFAAVFIAVRLFREQQQQQQQ